MKQQYWQLCPKCNGEGQIDNLGISSSLFRQCPLCKGAMIISTLTGLPPDYEANKIKREELEKEWVDQEYEMWFGKKKAEYPLTEKDAFPRTNTPEEIKDKLKEPINSDNLIYKKEILRQEELNEQNKIGTKEVSDILSTFPMDEQNKRIIAERKESLKNWNNTLEGKEEYAERITKEKKDNI